MKKTHIILFMLFFTSQMFAQYSISCKENKELAKTINEDLPSNTVLFVFNTRVPLLIYHKDIDKSKQRTTRLVDGFQKLYIPYDDIPNGTISIEYSMNGKKIKYLLGYGQVQGDHVFRREEGVRDGEIVCFDVNVKKSLDVERKISTHDINASAIQIETANDARVILTLLPPSLDFTIKTTDYITKSNCKDGECVVLVKPNISDNKKRVIVLQKEGYNDEIIDLGKIAPKENRFYSVIDRNYKKGVTMIESVPSGATITIDENKYFSKENNKTPYPYEGKSGEYTVRLKLKGYHDYVGQIIIGGQNKPFKLKPKLGFLTIPSNSKSYGATVFIDNKAVGRLPLNRYPLLEGKHVIRLSKKGYLFDKSVYYVNIVENSTFNFSNYNIGTIKRVKIITTPVKNVTVYIDNRLINKKTDFYINLKEGDHRIRLAKKHYKTKNEYFRVSQDKNEYYFTLKRGYYSVNIESTPGSMIYVDGIYEGRTPKNKYLPYGRHEIVFKRKGVVTEKSSYMINKNKNIHKNLYPSSFTSYGAHFGVGQIGGDFGITSNRWYLGLHLSANINRDSIEVSQLKIHKISVDNIDEYSGEYGRVYESSNASYGLKVGYLIRRPFPVIINGGASLITSDSYYKVHKSKYNYYDNYGHRIISPGELFSEPDVTEENYFALTAGVILPILKTVYVSVDYYTNSDWGSGFSFGLGLLIDMNYKNY